LKRFGYDSGKALFNVARAGLHRWMIKTMNQVNPFSALESIRFAGIRLRMKAFAYDFALILIYIAALTVANIILFLYPGILSAISPWNGSPIVMDAAAFLSLLLPVTIYFALQESSPRQATWGKHKFGLQVVGPAAGRLSFKRSLLRTALKFLPWQLAHTSIYQLQASLAQDPQAVSWSGFILVYAMAGIYLLSAVFSKKKQTLYDMLLASYVILRD
jgi:uncharacterized RDD family membrane protein YckC